MAEPFPGLRSAPGWAAVLYGRTLKADDWWRVVPQGVNHHGWLDSVVQAVVADGAGLRDGPRFLFAQNGVHRVVGVACQAVELSDSMHTDGSREMYCFVGWLTDVGPGGAAPGPEWTCFRQEYREWAAAVYERWMRPVWTAPASTLKRPHRVAAEAAPWPEAPRSGPLLRPSASPRVVPPADWAALWNGANSGADPATIVLGWPSADRARGHGATHLGVTSAKVNAPPTMAPTMAPTAAPMAPPFARPTPARRAPLLLIAGGGMAVAALAALTVFAVVGIGGDEEPVTGKATVNRGLGLVVGDGLPKELNGKLRYDGKVLTADRDASAATLPGSTPPSDKVCDARLAKDRMRKEGSGLPARPRAGLGVCLRTPDRLAFVRVDARHDRVWNASVTMWTRA